MGHMRLIVAGKVVLPNPDHTQLCSPYQFLRFESLKELGHHISDRNAINSTAILFLPYKEAISLDYCQFTGLWVQ